MYKSAQMNCESQLRRHAKRSSIWFNNNGKRQMKFHQGTPTEVFNKLET